MGRNKKKKTGRPAKASSTPRSSVSSPLVQQPQGKKWARLRIYSYFFITVFLVMCVTVGGYAYWFKAEDGPSPEQLPPGRTGLDPVQGPETGPAKPEPTPTVLVTGKKDFDRRVATWYYVPNSLHQQPFIPATAGQMMRQYGGIYLGKPDSKKVFLTFNAGYETGYTESILDTLKSNRVKAAFFVSKQYVNSRPALVKRMLAEGHLVASYTPTLTGLTSLTDDKVVREIKDTQIAFKAATGQDMTRLIRLPNGEYNERVLAVLQKTGYRPVFWSIAIQDWNTRKQPGADKAYQDIIDHIHPGAVILLHNVSSSSTWSLPKVIYELKRQGYQFGSLLELAAR